MVIAALVGVGSYGLLPVRARCRFAQPNTAAYRNAVTNSHRRSHADAPDIEMEAAADSCWPMPSTASRECRHSIEADDTAWVALVATLAGSEADWIEQQPPRIQGQAVIADAHDHLRHLASSPEVCLYATGATEAALGFCLGSALHQPDLVYLKGMLPSLSELAGVRHLIIGSAAGIAFFPSTRPW